MAPPRKRRRLSPASQSLKEIALFEPNPTSTVQSWDDVEDEPDLVHGVRNVPRRIEKVHLRIKERPRVVKRDNGAMLHRRQTTYPITTVDASGNTIVSMLTVGAGAGAATSNLAPTTPPTTPAPAATPSTPPANSQHIHDDTSEGKVSPAAASTKTRASRKPKAKDTQQSEKPADTTTLSRTYLATLTNGQVKTITRSENPYITTFGDGEVSTICNQYGQCRLSNEQTASPEQSSMSKGAQSTAAAASSSSDDGDDGGSPSIGTIAGAVVGSLAALAILLLLALVWMRWYKRRLRHRHQALTHESNSTPDQYQTSTPRASGMGERSGFEPLVGAVPGFFRHQDKSQEGSISSDRGFARLSGRKVPSTFDEGVARKDMGSPTPDMPLTGIQDNAAGAAFYRDSINFHDEDEVHNGSPTSSEKRTSVMLSPGPQRRPTIHEPGPYTLYPNVSSESTPVRHVRGPSGPGLSPFDMDRSGTPTGGRSETPTIPRSETPSTLGDNRSSRFTEGF